MSAAHEIVTLEPRRAPGEDQWVSVKVECSACDHVMFTAHRKHVVMSRESWIADHIAQHAPGRALDIEVGWEPSACCSVCEDGIGDIDEESSEVLICRDCGTTWNYDGTMGETDD